MSLTIFDPTMTCMKQCTGKVNNGGVHGSPSFLRHTWCCLSCATFAMMLWARQVLEYLCPNAKKPEEYLASTRWFANLVFPPYHDASFLRRFLGDLFWPFQTLLWWILSPILWVHFWLPWSMLPKFSLRWQLWHGHSVSICNAQKVKACGPMNGR